MFALADVFHLLAHELAMLHAHAGLVERAVMFFGRAFFRLIELEKLPTGTLS